MFDFILKKFVPFGLARTLSLAGVPLLQFAVLIFSSKVEAGRFYLISNAAFLASQVADIGISRAFPVLFGANLGDSNPRLPEIMLIRWVGGLLLGLAFIFFNRFGEITWDWSTTGLLAFLFCFGRIILLGNQGYRHARQEYSLLLKGAFYHLSAAITYLLLCGYMGKFDSNVAFAALTVGIWVELVVIDSPKAHPLNLTKLDFREAFKIVSPFATVGISTAIYGRAEAVVAGKLLAPATLGVFGTLDSAFKMCIWPSYVSAQSVFPAINHAIQNGNIKELQSVAKRHFKLGFSICLVAMIVTFIAWYLKFSHNWEITIASVILWLSIWLAIPNAFMIPLFYSFGLEARLAATMLKLAILRVFAAIVLAMSFGFIGLCATHAILTSLAVILLWWQIKGRLETFSKSN